MQHEVVVVPKPFTGGGDGDGDGDGDDDYDTCYSLWKHDALQLQVALMKPISR